MAEINVVPLVDVMLVLLVIFIIAAPLLTHTVRVDLPKASSAPVAIQTEPVVLAIRTDGRFYWNGRAVMRGELGARFAREARKQPQPELHIEADRLVPYETMAQVMSEAAKSGLTRIGFVTDPSQ